MTNSNESGLRGALEEMKRERSAVEDMFKEDTGADSVKIDEEHFTTKVTLTFRRKEQKISPDIQGESPE